MTKQLLKITGILAILCGLAIPASAQLANTSATNGSGAPAGACTSGSTYTDSGTGFVYGCTGSAWSNLNNPGDILSSFKPSGTIGSEVHKNLSINNGSTATILAQVNGAGYVSELFIASNQYNTEVIITVDGEGTPSIDQNIADLLGDNYLDTQPAFNGPYISGSNNGSGQPGGTLRIPIPFATSVLIQVKNNSGGAAAVITSHVIYHTGVSDNWPYTQRLKFAGVNTAGIVANAETAIVNVTPNKRGRLVSVNWIYDGFPGTANPRTAPLEGAFKIYLDGAGSANYATGGSEDFFGEPWYFQNFDKFPTVAATNGPTTTMVPNGTDNILTIKNANTWGAQRFFIKDPITFQNALKVTWTCGNTGAVSFTGTCKLLASVYYYVEN